MRQEAPRSGGGCAARSSCTYVGAKKSTVNHARRRATCRSRTGEHARDGRSQRPPGNSCYEDDIPPCFYSSGESVPDRSPSISKSMSGSLRFATKYLCATLTKFLNAGHHVDFFTRSRSTLLVRVEATLHTCFFRSFEWNSINPLHSRGELYSMYPAVSRMWLGHDFEIPEAESLHSHTSVARCTCRTDETNYYGYSVHGRTCCSSSFSRRRYVDVFVANVGITLPTHTNPFPFFSF